LGNQLSFHNYQTLLGDLGLLESAPLEGIPTQPVAPLAPLTEDTATEAVLAAAVGQGELTINLLQVARLLSAVTNQGSAPGFHLATAYRSPDQTTWHNLKITSRQRALLRTEVALEIKTLLRHTAQTSPLLQDINRTDITIRNYEVGGQVGVALAGRPLTWFYGFLDLKNGKSFVLVIVMENSHAPEAIVQMAGDVFQAISLVLEKER
jgi:cell division protein FtsI/penicillin-binding protein 2